MTVKIWVIFQIQEDFDGSKKPKPKRILMAQRNVSFGFEELCRGTDLGKIWRWTAGPRVKRFSSHQARRLAGRVSLRRQRRGMSDLTNVRAATLARLEATVQVTVLTSDRFNFTGMNHVILTRIVPFRNGGTCDNRFLLICHMCWPRWKHYRG